MKLFASLVSILLTGGAIAAPANAESLPELWQRPIRASYDSPKSAMVLEYCIGGAVSEWGYPHVLHGEGITDIWVGLPYAIRVSDSGALWKVSFTATKAYDDRVAKAISACL